MQQKYILLCKIIIILHSSIVMTQDTLLHGVSGAYVQLYWIEEELWFMPHFPLS